MMSTNGKVSGAWVSLGEACRLLGVNQTTLRQWADDGVVRVFRTPGGHRRFQRSDLEAVLRRSGVTADTQAQEDRESALLRRIRRRLQSARAAQQPWQANIDEAGRGRMRVFGRRLLSLLDPQSGARGRRPDLLQEAETLGHEYGMEMARLGLSLRDTLSAFLFFRNTIPTEDGSELADAALDQVLLGIGSGYEQSHAPGTRVHGDTAP